MSRPIPLPDENPKLLIETSGTLCSDISHKSPEARIAICLKMLMDHHEFSEFSSYLTLELPDAAIDSSMEQRASYEKKLHSLGFVLIIVLTGFESMEALHREVQPMVENFSGPSFRIKNYLSPNRQNWNPLGPSPICHSQLIQELDLRIKRTKGLQQISRWKDICIVFHRDAKSPRITPKETTPTPEGTSRFIYGYALVPLGSSDFNQVVEAFGYEELPYVGGAAPRTNVIGRVFTANESPPDQIIPFHHEMAQV
ncbi:hypothetical protein IFM89_009269 [Coptis chinensis]|uniref:Uncharacterized protein n=1 Tax=Coptis chinensis TaxID=261450 RepID=A0A835M4F6_9MAGN|nr:hypothetical protein IFM89_009269 [Coptis chinensis]